MRFPHTYIWMGNHSFVCSDQKFSLDIYLLSHTPHPVYQSNQLTVPSTSICECDHFSSTMTWICLIIPASDHCHVPSTNWSFFPSCSGTVFEHVHLIMTLLCSKSHTEAPHFTKNNTQNFHVLSSPVQSMGTFCYF